MSTVICPHRLLASYTRPSSVVCEYVCWVRRVSCAETDESTELPFGAGCMDPKVLDGVQKGQFYGFRLGSNLGKCQGGCSYKRWVCSGNAAFAKLVWTLVSFS